VEAVFLRNYLSICLERLRKTTENLSEVIQSPGRHLSPGPSEYEAGVLTTRPGRSICEAWNYMEARVFCDGTRRDAVPEVASRKDASRNGVPVPFFSLILI
jgi:hypothetical protein